MNIEIVKIDSAVVMPDAEISENEISFTPNTEYKYLSAFPLCEDGSYIAVASKDMKEWVLCIGAYINGKAVDVRDIANQIAKMSK